MSPERMVSALQLAEIENVTPNKDYAESTKDQETLNQARNRRSVFKFKMVDIPVGTELTYVNDANIKVTVIDIRQIKFNDEVTSLSALAKTLLGYLNQVQGTLYWKSNGATLDEHRRRLESE